jgi:hypothetical protein
MAAMLKHDAERKPRERSSLSHAFVRCMALLQEPETRRLHRRIGQGLGPQPKATPTLQQILDDARKSMGAS